MGCGVEGNEGVVDEGREVRIEIESEFVEGDVVE